ncbi:hypothetical protein WJX72_010728 [[Myrmecia] bisecta]|uniref:G-patch domain-containing protein n=1 Tax=[Myrmecia] bisecta TaxID=41462 RepID=A0AAW1QGS6_9CHLO
MKLPPGYVPGEGTKRATAYGGFGERLLQQMGWQKGQSLGLTGTGLKQAIEVKKKDDTKGIGATARYQWEEKWWESAYNTAVKDIDKEAASSSDSDSGASSEDDFHPVQGAAGKKPKKDKGRKKQRLLAQQATGDVDGDSASETAPSAKRQKGGRCPDAADAAAQPQAAKASRRTVVIEAQAHASTAALAAAFVPTPARGWWGCNYFRSAGSLGGMDETAKHVARERQTFDEDDQAELWMKAQSGKTANKKGLGTSGAIGKVAGARWEGTRVTFGEGPGQESLELPVVAIAAADGRNSNASSATTEQLEMPSSNGAAQPAAESIKWKKLTVIALRKAPKQQMQLKKLRNQVVAAAAAKQTLTDAQHVKLLKKQWLAKVQSSSQFVLEGKYVWLADI